MSKGSVVATLEQIEVYDSESGDLNVIIETPQGSRNKYKWDDKRRLFTLDGVMPAGSVFPYDFGFAPSTKGEDGDPLDVLVIMDAPAFTGCLVVARLIGVIEAEQTERDGVTQRNDRFIAVAAKSHNQRDITALDQLNASLVEEIEHYFIAYNEVRGKEFKPLARSGPARAKELVQEGAQRYKDS